MEHPSTFERLKTQLNLDEFRSRHCVKIKPGDELIFILPVFLIILHRLVSPFIIFSYFQLSGKIFLPIWHLSLTATYLLL